MEKHVNNQWFKSELDWSSLSLSSPSSLPIALSRFYTCLPSLSQYTSYKLHGWNILPCHQELAQIFDAMNLLMNLTSCCLILLIIMPLLLCSNFVCSTTSFFTFFSFIGMNPSLHTTINSWIRLAEISTTLSPNKNCLSWVQLNTIFIHSLFSNSCCHFSLIVHI